MQIMLVIIVYTDNENTVGSLDCVLVCGAW